MDTLQPIWANCSILTVNRIFLMMRRNVLYFNFCPLPFDMSLVVNQMSLVSLLYCLFLIMCLYSCISLTPSVLFTRLNNTNSQSLYIDQMLQSFNHGISVDSFQYVHLFAVLGRTALDTALHMWFNGFQWRERITSLDLLAKLFSYQPRTLLAAFASILIAHV